MVVVPERATRLLSMPRTPKTDAFFIYPKNRKTMEKNLIKNFAEIDAKSTKRYYLGANEDCKDSLLLCDMDALAQFLQACALIDKCQVYDLCAEADGKHKEAVQSLSKAMLLFTETCGRWGSIAEDIADYIRDTKQL